MQEKNLEFQFHVGLLPGLLPKHSSPPEILIQELCGEGGEWKRLKVFSLGAQGRAHRLPSPGLEGSSLWNVSGGWWWLEGPLLKLPSDSLTLHSELPRIPASVMSLEVTKIMHLPAL